MLKNSRGFTLIELIVVMGIFVTVMAISSYAFQTVLSQAGQQVKSVETEIEGVVGLEILRSDLAHAGLGLPWSLNGASYLEAAVAPNFPVTGVNSNLLNDAPNNPPRAVVSVNRGNSDGYDLNGADYLVIKTPAVGLSETAKKWGDYTAAGAEQNNSSPRFVNTDWVIAVNHRFNSVTQSDKIYRGKAIFSQVTSLKPQSPSDNISLYGVDPDNEPRMPFNRADYYIDRPTETNSIPATCAPNTGILYKTTVINRVGGSGGGFSFNPLLDCVADMQVVYGLDTNGDGGVDLHADAPLATAAAIRTQLKEVRVYILAQEGGKDRNFTYPNTKVMVGEKIAGVDRGREFDFTNANITEWRNYRWKIYTLVVRMYL
ncbi:MAG: hypothetical protein FD174_2395 [Geobacteraceae bacterium]|nr:MAG: hypothetical protein FD174_2395 [Geobacteraceae bacterium]